MVERVECAQRLNEIDTSRGVQTSGDFMRPDGMEEENSCECDLVRYIYIRLVSN